jgi:hypothetical protein
MRKEDMKSVMKAIAAAIIAVGLMSTVGCTVASPDAGHQAVWVEKPMLFGHGGVDQTPVSAGQEYGAFTSNAIDVTMQPQRIDMEFDDMMTKSGVPVSFHVLFVFRVTDAVRLVQGYGVDEKTGEAKGAWNRVMDSQINQLVRDSVKAYDMQDIAISQSAVDAVSKQISTGSFNIAKSTGLPIELLSVNVGRILPPDAIKHQRIETAAQEQRVITEQQKKLAEDARKAAEESRAAADKAYLEKMQLSPQQYVELERIKMLDNICGKSACTFIQGTGAVPTLDVKK